MSAKHLERVRISMVPLPQRGQLGPSVQSGVDATLSRWRSPVQIRYGSLTWERRQLADHFGLEPEMLRVRIPPFLPGTQHGMCRFPCEGRMASSTLAGCTSLQGISSKFGLPTGSGPVTSNHGCRVRLLSGLLDQVKRRRGTRIGRAAKLKPSCLRSSRLT